MKNHIFKWVKVLEFILSHVIERLLCHIMFYSICNESRLFETPEHPLFPILTVKSDYKNKQKHPTIEKICDLFVWRSQ